MFGSDKPNFRFVVTALRIQIALSALLLTACAGAAATPTAPLVPASTSPSPKMATTPTQTATEMVPEPYPPVRRLSPTMPFELVEEATPTFMATESFLDHYPVLPLPGNDTQLTATPRLDQYHREASLSLSPIEQLSATTVNSYLVNPDGKPIGAEYHSRVIITDNQHNRRQVVVDEWRDYGLGYTFVLGWSGDGSRLYIADQLRPDEGCGPVFVENLRLVDVESGEIIPLVATLGLSPTISPGGDRLASVGVEAVIIKSLNSGVERIVPFAKPDGNWLPGAPVWSPDGSRLLLSITHDPCGPPADRTGSLLLIDPAQAAARSLLERDGRLLHPVSWPLDESAQLSGAGESTWWLDVASGSVSAQPPVEVGIARKTLFAFFEALNTENYAEAAELYGGSYDFLLEWFEPTDPDDPAMLLQDACNLLLCELPLGSAVLTGQPAPGEYTFEVTFLTESGETWALGPCCGASIEDMPPRSRFLYTVRRDAAGKFGVLGLPIYVP